jgi:class 3 adenylate cyclase
MQAAASNRTLICSVVFLDIIGYSKKPVSEQILFKERLNTLLTEALANVAPNDRIILDTGDGAALSFIGDPEDALFVSLTLRDALAGPQPAGPEMKMRIGINLGPVKLVKDINGQPNIIGDGINVAQRVMSFSQPGQILVSRSYYEVVSCLSEQYVKLFHYEGSRTDKHVREHEVYAVESTGQALLQVAASNDSRKKPTATISGPIDLLARSASNVTSNLRRRPRLGTALAVIAILAVAVGVRMNRHSSATPVATPASPDKVAAASADAPAKETSKTAAIEKPAATVPAKEKAAAVPAKKHPSAPPKAATKPHATPAPVANAGADVRPKPAASGGSGTLLFTIRPYGEIYVDGRREGDTPPMYELKVSAGRHRIELRHPEFPPYVQTVDVSPGGRVQIRYWFQSPSLPNPLQRR